MVNCKAGKAMGYPASELSQKQMHEIGDLSHHPKLLARLVKLLCGGGKASDDTRCSPDRSLVSLSFGDALKSTDTLRSTSESEPDPFARAMAVRVVRTPSFAKNRKRERKNSRRKGKSKKHPEDPISSLTTIHEIPNTSERSSTLAPSKFMSTKQLLTEDALMDSDSIRARAAIALARAQLERSRPASISRKRERAANKLMMLPGEFEESQITRARKQASVFHLEELPDVDDPEAIRRAVQQSRSTVMTLLAAQEAAPLRTDVKKHLHGDTISTSAVGLLQECQALLPEVFERSSAPLCPPPSMPLPQPPRVLTAAALPPRRTSLRRTKPSPSGSLKSLPTEYDGVAAQRVGVLIQDALNSRSEGAKSRDRSTPVLPSSEPAFLRRINQYGQTGIRAHMDRAALVPAPISSSGQPSLVESLAVQRRKMKANDRLQPGAQKTLRPAIPFGQQGSQRPRPRRLQSFLGPDIPILTVASGPRHPQQDKRESIEPLAYPIETETSKSHLQQLTVHTLTARTPSSKPMYASYRYI